MRKTIWCALVIGIIGAPFAEQPLSARELPPVEAVVAQFDAVAFEHEHGPSRRILLKWLEPPRLSFFASGLAVDDQRWADIRAHAQEIHDLTGLSWRVSRRAEDASLRFGFLPRAEFANLPQAAELTTGERRFLTGSACLALAANDADQPGVIRHAAIVIGTDISARLSRHCLLEEMVQVMGLPNDACRYRPSLFCEDDVIFEMTAADRILLQTLYDPRLKPGMARAEALPIAAEIIRAYLAEAAPATGPQLAVRPDHP